MRHPHAERPRRGIPLAVRAREPDRDHIGQVQVGGVQREETRREIHRIPARAAAVARRRAVVGWGIPAVDHRAREFVDARRPIWHHLRRFRRPQPVHVPALHVRIVVEELYTLLRHQVRVVRVHEPCAFGPLPVVCTYAPPGWRVKYREPLRAVRSLRLSLSASPPNLLPLLLAALSTTAISGPRLNLDGRRSPACS
jgi:hypothetical protein